MVKKVILYSFISVCFIAIISLGIVKTIQISNTQTVLTSTQNELTSTKTDLSNTQNTLAATKTELSQTKADLSTAKTEVSNTKDKLQTTSKNLENTTLELNQTKEKYNTTYSELIEEKELYDTLQISLDNLQANYNTSTAGYDYVYRDPTYQEVKAFIAADTNDLNTYVVGVYESVNFAMDIKANALKQKIRCGYVAVRFGANTGQYLLVAFNTTDRGIIYIYPPTDEEVNLQVGKHFWTECVIPKLGTHYTNPTMWDDTVKYFKTTW